MKLRHAAICVAATSALLLVAFLLPRPGVAIAGAQGCVLGDFEIPVGFTDMTTASDGCLKATMTQQFVADGTGNLTSSTTYMNHTVTANAYVFVNMTFTRMDPTCTFAYSGAGGGSGPIAVVDGVIATKAGLHPGEQYTIACTATHTVSTGQSDQPLLWSTGDWRATQEALISDPPPAGMRTTYAVSGGSLCNGKIITMWVLIGFPLVGTPGDDVIGGAYDTVTSSDQFDDIIDAGAGDDVVCSWSGDDTVQAGAGNDQVFSGPGNDKVFGAQGADVIVGGPGNDTIHGNRGEDSLHGGDGDDRIFGYAHNDLIMGGPGDDRLHGNFGDDVVDGEAGNDRIFGYGDNDVLKGGDGNDLLGGNFGDDNLDGGDGDDTLYGSDGDDVVSGGPGNDKVEGNSLNDVLNGGAGNDELDGGIGTDTCNGNSGVDTATRCESTTGVP